MVFTRLTMKGLGWIDAYLAIGLSAPKTVNRLGPLKQTVYNVICFLEEGKTG